MNKKNWLYLVILTFGLFWIIDLGDNLEEIIRLLGGCSMVILGTYKNCGIIEKIDNK